MSTSERLLLIGAILVAVVVISAIARSLARRRHRIERIEPDDLVAGSQVVVFTSPYCHGCRQWIDALSEIGVVTQAIDIGEQPSAAARYRINTTPRVLVVDSTGTTVREFDHFTPREHDLDAILRLTRA